MFISMIPRRHGEDAKDTAFLRACGPVVFRLSGFCCKEAGGRFGGAL